jgi:hypothetical protein
LVALAALVACGGGDDDDADASGGAQEIQASVRANSERIIAAEGTECTFDGDRQVVARGIVRNTGEQPYSVQISVRFLDADGVRVDLASDSVSDLEPGESSRWEASVYADDGADVTRCEVSTQAH